jgi:flagellar hook assembly protein FlgD
MTLSRALLGAALLALLGAWPSAAGVRVVAREVPVRTAALERPQRAPLQFEMVGLHWRGSGTVWFRTRSLTGVWSRWQPARPEAEDLPDRGTAESASRPGWKLGNPYWTDVSGAIEYRVRGNVSRLRAFFIQSAPDPTPLRVAARAGRPAIIRRSQWGADELIVRAAPDYAERVRFAVVHHTAGTNSYTAAQSAAIVRGIQRYHVLANGWNDIGYNFLVDKYGQIFEGRGGGIDRNVVGAHAQGFNTGSTGVSLLGTYSSSRISTAGRSALVKLLAWRLDVAHVDPLSRLTWISGGNPEYPAGTPVRLRAISGHRDTGPTSCPGTALYGQLPGIASSVAARGLPKLYDPEVAGGLGGNVRVTGRLSTTLPWTVTIRSGDGSLVASGRGSGTRVDWTWDASGTPFGTFTYTIEAGPDLRPWTASVPGPPLLAVQSLRAAPAVLTPNGDGVGETTRISFSLTTAATATVEIVDGSGATVRRLANAWSFPAGVTRLLWDGRTGSGVLVPDGLYSVLVAAQSPGQSDSATKDLIVDRTLGHLAVAPRPFSPNGDGRRETTTVTFELARPATTRVLVLYRDQRIATLRSAADLQAGVQSFVWDGRTRWGTRAVDRRYAVRVEASTPLGTRLLSSRVRVDTTPPAVRIARAVAGRRTSVTVVLGEAALLKVRFGASTVVWLDAAAGTHTISRAGVFRYVRAIAWDGAENRAATPRVRVRRLS